MREGAGAASVPYRAGRRKRGTLPSAAMPLLACILLLAAADGDTGAWLAKLRSPSSVERASAQSWLARHLESGDVDLVRAAAASGDAESRRRLALALADDDAHVALAVSLAADAAPQAAALGRDALEERLARWCPGWTRGGLDRSATLRGVRVKGDRAIAVDPRTKDRRLDLAVDQLVRFAPGAVPIVLDPDLALSEHPREATSATVLQGSFERVLDELVRLHRADLEGFAVEREDDPEASDDAASEPDGPRRPWILVRRAVEKENRRGTDRMIDWCVEIARAGEPARRSACARALAATGWSGGIAWLEQRAFAAKDEAALDGVLLAAARGQVAPSLARPEIVRDLLARPSDERARAVAAAGPIGPKGEDLGAVVAESLATLPPREQWLRLVALEGMRSPSTAVVQAEDSLLAAPKVAAPVRFQALRARAESKLAPGVAVAVADASALLAWADDAGKGSECARLLAALAVAPGPPGSPVRFAELEWAFLAGDGSGAAPRIVSLANGAGLEALAERTRAWVRRGAGARFDATLAAARALPGADAEKLERLALLSGAGGEELRSRWIAKIGDAPRTREDLLGLAAAAGAADGPRARAALVHALASDAKLDDVAAALELAVDVLRAARRDEDERAFAKAVGDAVREGSKEARSRFRVDTWPPRRAFEPVRADDLDRSLDRSGV